MNNQVSIAGQSLHPTQKYLAGAPLSCADHNDAENPHSCVSAAPFDQQATIRLETSLALPADLSSSVDVQSEPEIHDKDDIDHPSMSEGQWRYANHLSGADAHLQESAGQCRCDNQFGHASGFALLDDDGQRKAETQNQISEVVTPNYRDQETIASIKALYKQRNDIIRAHGNLTRQVTSICYHAAGFNTFLPEKERAAAMKAGNRLLAALKINDPAAETVFDSAGYLLGVIERSEFDKQKHLVEKKMAVAVGSLDMDFFIEEVRGFSHTQLANIIGEAGDIANYGTVSRLWKRMGLAVIDGVRQSKQTDKSNALDHGYNPSRRSAMWNIGETIIKAQVRNIKDEDGNKTDESSAIGYLGQVYLDRKKDYAARHPEKSKAHIHNDAKRYMEKRLLKMLWQAWNK